MPMGSRPDCAYFLLLGLCGAAFLLTIGGILTYVAFNPGTLDGHAHSAMSHIPHFHHHHAHPHNNHPHNDHPHPPPHHPSSPHHNQSHPIHSNSTHSLSPLNSTDSTTLMSHPPQNSTTPLPKHLSSAPIPHPHNSSSLQIQVAFEAKAKQSLILAIIGPLCLLMGILITIIVGVLALKYDCDHEPQPNISFLRLRSEMSLNFDPDKNNYELLHPSSSIEQAGGHFSINPTGLDPSNPNPNSS